MDIIYSCNAHLSLILHCNFDIISFQFSIHNIGLTIICVTKQCIAVNGVQLYTVHTYAYMCYIHTTHYSKLQASPLNICLSSTVH